MISFLKKLRPAKLKETPLNANGDVEAEASKELSATQDRVVEHQNKRLTNKFETLMNFLKCAVGTGIYSMPLAFSKTGILTGIFATIITAVIVTHCMLLLLRSSQKLCLESEKTSMSFSEVAENSCKHGLSGVLNIVASITVLFSFQGPKFVNSWGNFLKHFTSVIIGLTYFGTCSVYTVIVAQNFEQIAHFYFGVQVDLRIYILAILVPCILICWIPHLKQIAPLSVVANVFVLIGLVITFYYCFKDMPSISSRPLHTSFFELPSFFGIAIFAMAATGAVLPLQKQMKRPEQMGGKFGVLNQGMLLVTLLYGFVGIVGFIKYGDDIEDSITLNLPIHEAPAQVVKIFIAVAVFFSISLQFYVLLDIFWNAFEEKVKKNRTLVNYMLRTVLVSIIVLLAAVVPTIGPFVSLVGALCVSILGLLLPVFFEMATCWEEGYGKFNWIAWKNLLITIFGMMAMVLGTKDALHDIFSLYTGKEIHSGKTHV